MTPIELEDVPCPRLARLRFMGKVLRSAISLHLSQSVSATKTRQKGELRDTTEMVGSASKVLGSSGQPFRTPCLLNHRKGHTLALAAGWGGLGKNFMPSFVETFSLYSPLRASKVQCGVDGHAKVRKWTSRSNLGSLVPAFSGSAHFCLTVHFA
jgi:hypothetical protein